MSVMKEQLASKGITDQVDNMILQTILKMIEEAKLKDEEMLMIQLNICPFCGKQHILVKDVEDNEEECGAGICVICEKPVDANVIVYQFKKDGKDSQIICLESEAEEIVKKAEEETA